MTPSHTRGGARPGAGRKKGVCRTGPLKPRPVQVRLSVAAYTALKTEADARGVTPSRLFRDILLEYLCR